MTKERFKEISQFMGVGFAATLVDYILLNVFAVGAKLPILVANSIAAPFSSFVSYKLNKKVVFEDRMHSRRKTLLLYVFILAFGILIIQNAMLHFASGSFSLAVAHFVKPVFELVGLDRLSEKTLAINVSKMFASFFSALWNYFMLRKFVFVTTDEAQEN